MSSNLASTSTFTPTSAYGFPGFWKKTEITQHGQGYLDAKNSQLAENLELFTRDSENVTTQERILDSAIKNYDEITKLAKSILIVCSNNVSDDAPPTDDEKETIRQINIRINRISTSLLPNLEKLITRQASMHYNKNVKMIDDDSIKMLTLQGAIAVPFFAFKMMSDSSNALNLVANNVVIAAIILSVNIYRKRALLNKIESLKKVLKDMLTIPTLPVTLSDLQKPSQQPMKIYAKLVKS